MRSIKIVFYLFILGILLFLLGTVLDSSKPMPSKVETGSITPSVSPTFTSRQKANVLRVIDGDTIEVRLGDKVQKVRYIGIDTPESVEPRATVQCFGKEAALKNKELVEGKLVELEKDVSETDAFGRLLRYVFVNGIFVNDELVRQGFAHASTFPPDVKYQERFIQAQKEAQEQNRGLWAACS